VSLVKTEGRFEKVELGNGSLVRIRSGGREADFALSEWSSMQAGWLNRLNGLNGGLRAI
jgi:hypothetical protein